MKKVIAIFALFATLSADDFVEWVYKIKRINIEFKYGAWFTNLERQEPTKGVGIATANYPAMYGTGYIDFKTEPTLIFPLAHITNTLEVSINPGIMAIEARFPINTKLGLYAEMVLFRRPYANQTNRYIGIINNYSKNDQGGIDFVTLPVKWSVYKEK